MSLYNHTHDHTYALITYLTISWSARGSGFRNSFLNSGPFRLLFWITSLAKYNSVNLREAAPKESYDQQSHFIGVWHTFL